MDCLSAIKSYAENVRLGAVAREKQLAVENNAPIPGDTRTLIDTFNAEGLKYEQAAASDEAMTRGVCSAREADLLPRVAAVATAAGREEADQLFFVPSRDGVAAMRTMRAIASVDTMTTLAALVSPKR